ncbi:MAG: hypothetical protein ACYCQI_00335 [Gammaproteobacteria bacterium]
MSKSRDTFFSQKQPNDLIGGYLGDAERADFDHSILSQMLESDFKKSMEKRDAEMAPFILHSELQNQLARNENLLKIKEKQLHAVRRSARDNTLDSILAVFGFPGGIASSVKGIAIGYDKVTFGSIETDGTSHQLEDHVTKTSLENEVTKLREKIEGLKLEISQVKDMLQQGLRLKR